MSTEQRRICVSICEKDINALLTALRSAENGDFVEIRLDAFGEKDLPAVIDTLNTFLKDSSLSTIITFRPLGQGGFRDIDLPRRLQFWREHGFKLPATFYDLEVDLVELLAETSEGVDWSRVICSFHDFRSGVIDLVTTYERLARTPARVIKLAVTIDDASDNLQVFELLARANLEGRELIAIGMGTAGVATRILALSRGSFLTYVSSNKISPTAPGQLTSTELRDLYRADQIDKTTEVMGIIGCPISHSLSPQVHNAAYKAQALNAVYVPFEVRNLAAFMRGMVQPPTRQMEWKMRGLSVTTPHKQTVMEYLDWIDSAAKEIGAVNTIVIDDEGLKGYNTDAAGFINPLKGRLGNLRDRRCAVLGAGGAARAIIWALLREEADVTVFARNLGRAQSLTGGSPVRISELELASFEGFDLVVNTTVLGMAGEFEQQTPASAEQLGGARLAYDLVYNPVETQFLQEARKAGCETLGGLPMFVAQAAEQFRLWTGREAPIELMRAAATKALTES